MKHTLEISINLVLAIAILTFIRIHYLRAKIAELILDDVQFKRFQNGGLAGSALNNPARLIFEYRYIASILGSLSQPSGRKMLKAWKNAFLVFFFEIAALALMSIISICLGFA
jgi:hypothetical protein